MRIVKANEIDRIFTWPALIAALRDAFRAGTVSPVRHHHALALPDQPDATLMLMPAWDDFTRRGSSQGHVGVKIVSVYPGNAARNKPAVTAGYLLMAGQTGEPLAYLDGQRLTTWRTAAASALAASYLARPDASQMVMVGAGAMAPYLVAAHASVRPIAEVAIWNHRPERACTLAAALSDKGYRATATEDLEAAVRKADLVSCATLSTAPVVHGAWLKPGAHLDLVGAFTPDMRECDDEAVRRARVFVDTRAGALAEAGDLLQPLRAGVIGEDHILADLFALCRGENPGRTRPEEITLFKSVGAALEDLAAAKLAIGTSDPA